MTPSFYSDEMITAIESELHSVIESANSTESDGLERMLAYHMGWEGEGAGLEARGKRLRPLILLLTTASCGGDWKCAVPAAAAVELLHNFSLIHDDIQDQSPLRRGRPTIWKQWGIAQAINVGDTMFTLAQVGILRLKDFVPAEVVIQASQILLSASIELTRGQFLDISYETRDNLDVESYWPMVTGKTAALLGACTELGALIAYMGDPIRAEYRRFGRLLGIAFQVQDDLLGIWGDSILTGKSSESDLVAGKKSLPVLYALGKNGKFSQRWRKGAITTDAIPELRELLEEEGALIYINNMERELTRKALQALESTRPQGEAGTALNDLAHWLLERQS